MKFARVFVIWLVVLLLFSLKAEAKVALDPSVVGVGARSLGMGRAYVAIAGRPDSVFLNPASLAVVPRWGATSMYTNLLSQVNYVLLGGVRPLGSGVVGGGYLSASIGGLQNAVRDPITGRITFEAGLNNYYNNIYYLSYGAKIFEDVSAGINLKLYSQGFSSGASGNGYDADLGVTYRPWEDLTIGFLQRNFLPSSAGARIKWSTGAEESLATSSRLGANYDAGSYNLSADYEFFPTLPNEIPLLKVGAEWWAAPNLALRVGSDQDIGETNLTAGLSFLFSGFEFDYAYHPYGTLAENTTHTFSLSYGVFTEKGPELAPAPAPARKLIQVDSPADKSVLFYDSVKVAGTALPEVKQLKINGAAVTLVDGKFNSFQSFPLGKNAVSLAGYGDGGKKLAEERLRILRLKGFSDVPADYWAAVPISIMAGEEIISGYPDGTFRPEGNITRAEMCTLLMKSKVQRPTSEATLDIGRQTFKDVSTKHWAAPYIAQAAARGIVKGYPDGRFRPNGKITRAEGVVIIARFAELNGARVLEPPYVDVPGRHWAAKKILAAKEAGLLQFIGQLFEPNKKLTRAEVVEIISKTDLLAPKIKQILNFEEGY